MSLKDDSNQLLTIQLISLFVCSVVDVVYKYSLFSLNKTKKIKLKLT